MIPTASVLGCRVDLLDRSTINDVITNALEGDALFHVITVNPEQIMAARRDAATRHLVQTSDLNTVDGAGLALALRLQGITTFDRVTGVELLNTICGAGWPVYLLGGRPGAAENAATNLQVKHPAAQIRGAWSGGTPRPTDDTQTIHRIQESGARVVLVAYGFPAQQAWIERNRAELERVGVRVGVGIGGALDFAAGYASIAPGWISRIGLEWLYRLVREPWRWRRQLVLPVFAVLAFTEAIRYRMRCK